MENEELRLTADNTEISAAQVKVTDEIKAASKIARTSEPPPNDGSSPSPVKSNIQNDATGAGPDTSPVMHPAGYCYARQPSLGMT